MDLQRLVERYREEATRRYAEDNDFCWVCGFIGYVMFSRISHEEALADPALSDSDRRELATELAALSGLPLPTHSPRADRAAARS